MADDLKVFISWSGPFAKAVALALRDWLPNLTDRVRPWMSDVDIEAGARSMDDLATELNGTDFGIIVVTSDNQRAPWLNFEAGALSKQVQGAKARVAPLLMDMSTPTEVTGPLSQYQAQVFNESGMGKLAVAIASAAGVDKQMMISRFDKFWPDLDSEVVEIKARNAMRGPSEPARSERDLLDETLTRVRAVERTVQSLVTDLGIIPRQSVRPDLVFMDRRLREDIRIDLPATDDFTAEAGRVAVAVERVINEQDYLVESTTVTGDTIVSTLRGTSEPDGVRLRLAIEDELKSRYNIDFVRVHGVGVDQRVAQVMVRLRS